MHQVAHSYVNRFISDSLSTNTDADSPVRVVLLMANSLDCETLTATLGQHRQIEVLAATADVDFGLARCRRLRPQVLVLDPKLASDVVQSVAETLKQREVAHLLVLDDRLHEGRLAGLLDLPAVSYLTRQAGLDALVSAILEIADSGDRTFDPEVQPRIQRNPTGLRLRQTPDSRPLSSLTARELQVMKLLAGGYSVRGCAERLELAESTIDNHKSRLMKKLDIHKVVELTHVAIREGLIVVQ